MLALPELTNLALPEFVNLALPEFVNLTLPEFVTLLPAGGWDGGEKVPKADEGP